MPFRIVLKLFIDSNFQNGDSIVYSAKIKKYSKIGRPVILTVLQPSFFYFADLVIITLRK